MAELLNNALGATNSGMGCDDMGVSQPLPVDSDRAIESDIQIYNNIDLTSEIRINEGYRGPWRDSH